LNIINFLNTNIVSNRFVFLALNVLGNWNGNITDKQTTIQNTTNAKVFTGSVSITRKNSRTTLSLLLNGEEVSIGDLALEGTTVTLADTPIGSVLGSEDGVAENATSTEGANNLGLSLLFYLLFFAGMAYIVYLLAGGRPDGKEGA
jgi:aminopeptidase N